MIPRMPRRVLLLNTDLEIGGTPVVVRELAIRLARLGRAEIEVACLAPWGPVADQIAAAGIPVHPMNARGVNSIAAIGRLARLVRRGRYNTVMSFLIHANAAAAVASLLSPGVRLLQSIQSTMPDPKWHWWLQRVLHRRAAKMFVPSESIAQALRERSRVPAEKIVVIPNAICPDEFSPSPVPDSDPRPYPIGFLGRLDPVKRIEDILQAMPLLGGLAHLHIFGPGPQKEELVAQAKQLGIQGSVTFHGPVKMPQEALSNIGLVVLPSSSEGFGLVLIEAMAAGVPVIGTNVPGIRDVIRDGQTGILVPPFSPVELADAIRRVIERPELRRELVERAARDVRERFSWSQVLEQYCQLLALD